MTGNYFNLSIRAQDHGNHSLTSTANLLVYVNVKIQTFPLMKVNNMKQTFRIRTTTVRNLIRRCTM